MIYLKVIHYFCAAAAHLTAHMAKCRSRRFDFYRVGYGQQIASACRVIYHAAALACRYIDDESARRDDHASRRCSRHRCARLRPQQTNFSPVSSKTARSRTRILHNTAAPLRCRSSMLSRHGLGKAESNYRAIAILIQGMPIDMMRCYYAIYIMKRLMARSSAIITEVATNSKF